MNVPSNVTAEALLKKAIGLEEVNVVKCLLWAERFRPYREDISELLLELAEEERIYHKRLVEMYVARFGGQMMPKTEYEIDHMLDDKTIENDHYFVIDDVMSRRGLMDILKAEFESFVFFKQACDETKDPVLNDMYALLANCEGQHVHELRSSLEPNQYQ